MIDLVYHWDNGFAAAPQKIGDLLIERIEPLPPIEYKQDHRSLLDGCLGLPVDLAEQWIAPCEAEPAGIDNDKTSVLPFGGAVEPIPGYPGDLLFDSCPGSGESVEESRFSHIGPSDDGNDAAFQPGPSFAGKVYLIMPILRRAVKRDYRSTVSIPSG